MWRRLYPGGFVVGLDAGALMAPAFRGETRWFGEAGVGETVVMRGDGGGARDLARAFGRGPFDFVVDDASHLPEHQLAAVASARPS